MGLVDWRELVCSLYALSNTGYVHHNPIKLLTCFFHLYSLPTRHLIVVPRKHVLRLVSLAAITQADMVTVTSIAPYLPKMVRLSKFRNVLNKLVQVVSAFRTQLWAQLPDITKLTYLRLQEDASARWFEGYIHQHNIKKAVRLRKHSLLYRSYRGWCQFCKKMRVVRIQHRIVILRKCRVFISWWNFYATQRRASYERRQVATVLGHRALMRRTIMLRWRQWSCNERRIRRISGVFRGRAVDVSHGCFLIRHVHSSSSRRKALYQWRQWVDLAYQWHRAGYLMRKRLELRTFTEWRLHIGFVKAARAAETESIQNQIFLTSLVKEVNAEFSAARAVDEFNEFNKLAGDRKRALSEKLNALAWSKRRRDATRAADDRIKLAVQQDSRAKRISTEKEDRAASFQAAWDAMEHQYIHEQSMATRRWLDSRISKNHVLKEFKRLKREFYRPPTPRSIGREVKLKSLSSIVLIKMEAVLFQKGIVMEHFIRQYDEDSSGFLSHNEFRALVGDLPIDLSPEQVRLVISTLDSDQDGYVGLKELEKALDVVHQFNGLSASPWRMYIDPAQDVICYHNIATDRLVFEHRMNDKILLEITKSNFLAETKLEAINHIRRQRALVFRLPSPRSIVSLRSISHQAWRCVQEDCASRVLARMYQQFKSKRELGRLMWKIQARRQRQDMNQHSLLSVKLQCWWRSILAHRVYCIRLRHHVEIIPDLVERRL